MNDDDDDSLFSFVVTPKPKSDGILINVNVSWKLYR